MQWIAEQRCYVFQISPKAGQETGESACFRYELKMKNKVHCFVPKPLDADSVNWLEVRGSQLGATYVGSYDKIPRTTFARTVFEVSRLKDIFVVLILMTR